MPRIATPPPIEVISARAKLRAHMKRHNITQNALSLKSGVPQYTISKFLSGHIKSITPNVFKLIIYANNGINFNIEALCKEPLIVQALSNAWDGTDEGISLIASAINALAPIIKSASFKQI